MVNYSLEISGIELMPFLVKGLCHQDFAHVLSKMR